MSEPINDQKNFWDEAWKLLWRGKSDRKHPYAFPAFATSSSTSHPRSRTLVLRNALKESSQLWCYTDRRSRKATDIDAGAKTVSYTFWSPRARIQVTATGPTEWLDPERTDEIFHSLPKHSRKAYATLAPPGSVLTSPGQGLPPDWDKLALKETDFVRPNFGVLVTTIENMDLLQLHREGHRRMGATRTGEDWSFEWLVP